MREDVVLELLKQVKSGKVSIDDARSALDGVELSEETYEPTPGTVVRSSLSPAGDSIIIILLGLWGIVWTLFWAGSLSYGLYNHWDQQLLSLFLAMTLTTLIILGIVYLRFVMPDLVIIKHRRNKYITPNDSEGWKKYEV
jgi:membrane-bound ClpP family serine protease